MRTALYTTIYPANEAYLSAWEASVLSQSDHDFDVWIGVDGYSTEHVKQLLPSLPSFNMIINDNPNNKAHIRRKTLDQVVSSYDAVVLVDSDDVLKPKRVENAKQWLREYDVIGCSLALIDINGHELGTRFGNTESSFSVDSIIYSNQFGLSNTAYRCKLLEKCLDIPDQCELVDWFLVTKAWLAGARIAFDPTMDMLYRQYPNNATKILSPFTSEDIEHATRQVLQHFSLFLNNSNLYSFDKIEYIQSRYRDVKQFYDYWHHDKGFTKKYITQFNTLTLPLCWWCCVANQNLEALWK